MKKNGLQNQVKLWRIKSSLGGMDLLKAHYLNQRFSRHSHRRFPLGVVTAGALGFRYRGEEVVAPAGAVNLTNPGEPHNGHPETEAGWTYRMFYFEPKVIAKARKLYGGAEYRLPAFQMGVIEDPHLAWSLARLHADLECGGIGSLERDERLICVLGLLISRHADTPLNPRPAGREHQAVKRAKDFLRGNYDQDVPLGRLAKASGLSPYHLHRVFARQTGLAPHQYLTQIRVRRARDLLLSGTPIAQAALQVGFSDQSHLTRRFKAVMGLTPGQFIRQA